MPFGIFVEVETLHASTITHLRAIGILGEVNTTSRTFSGDASMRMDVWRVALNQDMIGEVMR